MGCVRKGILNVYIGVFAVFFVVCRTPKSRIYPLIPVFGALAQQIVRTLEESRNVDLNGAKPPEERYIGSYMGIQRGRAAENTPDDELVGPLNDLGLDGSSVCEALAPLFFFGFVVSPYIGW